jgi:LEA14-like dessication related protein
MKKALITTAILGGVGLLGYSIYRFYKKQFDLLKDFKYEVLSFNIDQLTLNNVTGKINFRFYSMSDIEIMVNEFYMTFGFNNENIGYIKDSGIAHLIPANGYNDLEFEFQLNPQFIIKNAVDIIAYATKQKDATITLDGNISVSSGFVHVTVPINCNCSIAKLDCAC